MERADHKLGHPQAGPEDRQVDLGIPDRLGQVGVQARSILPMARRTMQSPNVAINPRKTTQEDIVQIFKNAV